MTARIDLCRWYMKRVAKLFHSESEETIPCVIISFLSVLVSLLLALFVFDPNVPRRPMWIFLFSIVPLTLFGLVPLILLLVDTLNRAAFGKDEL
jgi:hypothetical protein